MYIHVVVDTTGHLNAFKSASVYDMFYNICESFAVNTHFVTFASLEELRQKLQIMKIDCTCMQVQ